MPFPFCSEAFLPPGNPDDVCAVMRRTMQLHEYVKLMVGYMVDCTNGNMPAKDFALEICAQTFVPGMMIPYRVNTSSYTDIGAEVKKIWGDPNSVGLAWWEVVTELEGRFPIGASADIQPNNLGGEKTVALTVEEMPAHIHEIPDEKKLPIIDDKVKGAGGGFTGIDMSEANAVTETTSAGNGRAHNNMPPYRAIVWIRRTSRMQV